MALAAQVSTIEGLDENISALYKANGDDGFILDVTDTTTDKGAYGLADFGGLKSALEGERGISSALKAEATKFKGFDIEAANEAIEFKTKYTGKTSDDLDLRVAELQKGYDDKLSVANTATEAAVNDRNQYMLGHSVDAAMAAREDVLPTMSKWLRAEVLTNLKVGDGAAFVADAAGNARMSAKASSTGNMDVGELVDIMSQDPTMAGFFKAAGAGNGTGSQQSGGAPIGGTLTQTEFRALGEGEKNVAYAANPEAYKSFL